LTDREFETSCARFLVAGNPSFSVQYNVGRRGRYSETMRQIDVLLSGDEREVVVECKYYGQKLNVKMVDSFIGFLDDVGIDEGVIITNIGMSTPGLRRMANTKIKLHILSEADLSSFRLRIIQPYENDRRAHFLEPNGYIAADYPPSPTIRCCFYPIGRRFEDALVDGEILYVNLHDRPNDVDSIVSTEKQTVNTSFEGKISHRTRVDRYFTVRKSFLKDHDKVDFSVVRKFKVGLILMRGVVRPENVDWTITSIKESMLRAHFYESKVTRSDDGVIHFDLVWQADPWGHASTPIE